MRNGLQAAAARLCPPIHKTLDAIRQHSPWVLLSGSGATCFGVFESERISKSGEHGPASVGLLDLDRPSAGARDRRRPDDQ